MPTMTNANREARIDALLADEQAAKDEQARAAVRDRLIEEERLAQVAAEQAEQAAKHAAYLKKAEAAHAKACARYTAAEAEFRAARLDLHALDSILGLQGFPNVSLGIELRHRVAAPAVGEVVTDLGAAVASMRRTLGG